MEYLFLFVTELIILFILSQKVTTALFYLFFKLTRNKKISVMLFALVLYPGVLIHELAHYFMALICMVPVGNMEFSPVPDESGIKLGSVGIGKTDPIRRMLIGVAPLIVGTLVIIVSLYYIFSHAVINTFLQGTFTAYILFVIGNTMFSSKKDVEGTFELLAAFVIVGLILFFLGIKLPFSIIDLLSIPLVRSALEKASYYLIIPIALDALLVLLTFRLVR